MKVLKFLFLPTYSLAETFLFFCILGSLAKSNWGGVILYAVLMLVSFGVSGAVKQAAEEKVGG